MKSGPHSPTEDDYYLVAYVVMLCLCTAAIVLVVAWLVWN